MNVALMIIDMQNAFACGDCKTSMEQAAITINKTISLFRECQRPIIWVQDINPKEGATLGSKGFEIISCLDVNATEHAIHKTNMNAFIDTQCASFLREHAIDTVVLSGFCADYCVISTYHGAIDNGFTAAILKGGSAAGSQEAINRVDLACDTVGLSFLQQLLNKNRH